MSYELSISREIEVAREKLFRCWTEVELLDEWFCPKPYRTRHTVIEPHTGGRLDTEIFGPDGDAFPNVGVFLEVVENERLVWTDAYRAGWEPNEKLFMTGIATFEDLGGGRTRYTMAARHWSKEAMEKHLAMGFRDGWEKSADQLVELAKTL
ncbi:SRPBCC family protein [Haloferula sargassicola]|uniref:Activator of Hsp90 ATPase homologue 1/2-like C-terminal domain-containing protein n=1 Tax=Haloferula sargassicola TaxID=490096 RepID=A0ABP9UMB0_9BACT